MKFNSIRQPATTYVKLCDLFSYNFLENYTIFLYNSSEQKHSIEKMLFKVKNIAKRVHCPPKFYLYSIAIIKSLSQICVFCTFQFKSPYLHKAQSTKVTQRYNLHFWRNGITITTQKEKKKKKKISNGIRSHWPFFVFVSFIPTFRNNNRCEKCAVCSFFVLH